MIVKTRFSQFSKLRYDKFLRRHFDEQIVSDVMRRKCQALKRGPSWNYRFGIAAREGPPYDGAIGSAGVERRRIGEHGGGGDSVRRNCAGPYASHGSAPHDSLSRRGSEGHILGD